MRMLQIGLASAKYFLQTSCHSVAISISSIASLIPSSEDNDASFSGLTTPTVNKGYSAQVLHHHVKRNQIDAQSADAACRRVVWDADGTHHEIAARRTSSLEDAEGEPDEEYCAGSASSTHEAWNLANTSKDIDLVTPKPIGVRNAAGKIEPYE